MKRKKKDLQETESRTKSEDEMLDELLDELRREDNMVEEMKEQLRQRKRKFWRKVIIISSLVLFILVGSYLLIHYQSTLLPEQWQPMRPTDRIIIIINSLRTVCCGTAEMELRSLTEKEKKGGTSLIR